MRVLIVADEELNRKVLYLMLTRGCGSPVPDFARNSQEAASMYLKALTEKRPYSLMFFESCASGSIDFQAMKTMFEHTGNGITTVCMISFADNYRTDPADTLPGCVIRRCLTKPLNLVELRRVYHDACTAHESGAGPTHRRTPVHV